MKIKYSNFRNFFQKTRRFGIFIPLSNIILVYGSKFLPKSYLSWMSKRRNGLIQAEVRKIVGQVQIDEGSLAPTEQPKIWMAWLTGEDTLPVLPKMCVESVKRQAMGHEVVIVTLQNYTQYIELPERILGLYHEGILGAAHLTDIIRMRLLSRYGGFWIDATMYLTAPIDEQIFHNKLFSLRQKPDLLSHNRWASFCFYMDRSSLLPHVVDAMLMRYFERETWMIDYFLLDNLIDIATQDYPSVRKDVDAIPFNNPQLYALCPKLCDPFNPQEYDAMQMDTSMFKLSWKAFTSEQLVADKDSFFSHLLSLQL